MCGEKSRLGVVKQMPEGSPPHVRGKGGAPPLAFAEVRITPACAGKRLYEPLRHITKRDHPRMCGEKSCQEKN